MSQPEKKLDKFESAVLKDAENQRKKILAEIENYRKVEMEKAEEYVLHDTYVMIQDEIASIKNQQSRKISLAELEGRRKLLKLREELTNKVFKEAEKRIVEFSKTAEYATLLFQDVKKSAAELPDGELVIQVKNSDLHLAGQLIEASGRKALVEENINIELGGVILINREKGLVINQTLDLKLISQKDWFTASSGLTLGL